MDNSKARASVDSFVDITIGNIRDEAIRECAERLKERLETETYFDVDPAGTTICYEYKTVDVEDIDDLVKEMVGEY